MRILLLATSMVVLGACTDATSPSALRPGNILKDSDFNETEPAVFGSYNPCNGDAVAMTGTIHTLIHTTQATSGNMDVDIDLSGNYDGVGLPSGLNYQGSTRDVTHYNVANPLPVTFDIYQDTKLQSQTGADNYTMSLHYKITINANGVPTSTVDNTSNDCKG